ncbi:hypothetical protein evm_004669 [Chilo suppressalis]|nr:hypothetical protein evm_004669 [Chilo suppressalis]
MKPSKDGVEGRYTVEWCTKRTKNDTVWDLQIFFNRKNPSKCSYRDKHSAKIEDLYRQDVNCSFVCLSTEIDLIFNACYRLEQLFRTQGSAKSITNYNISNEYSMETFTRSVFTANEINHGDYISVNFFFGMVPVTSYEVTLCKLNDESYDREQSCEEVTQNCTIVVSPHGVTCRLRPLPPAAYELQLTHTAPWTLGHFMRERTHVRRLFNVTAPAPVKVATPRRAGWWIGAGGWGCCAAVRV